MVCRSSVIFQGFTFQVTYFKRAISIRDNDELGKQGHGGGAAFSPLANSPPAISPAANDPATKSRRRFAYP